MERSSQFLSLTRRVRTVFSWRLCREFWSPTWEVAIGAIGLVLIRAMLIT